MTMLAFAGGSATVYPQFALFYFLGAIGISLIFGGVLALTDLTDNHIVPPASTVGDDRA
jgi:hypothetical protein